MMNKKIFSILLFLLSSMYACATLCMEFEKPKYPSVDSMRGKLGSWQNAVESNSLLSAQFEETYGSPTSDKDELRALYDMRRAYGSHFGHEKPYTKLEYTKLEYNRKK